MMNFSCIQNAEFRANVQAMILGSMFWLFMIHTGLRNGYGKHLADSLSTRAAGSDHINFDVSTCSANTPKMSRKVVVFGLFSVYFG